ncbi:hypothetical protein Hanom_Chr04g00312261 [Helianthus anomalus]
MLVNSPNLLRAVQNDAKATTTEKGKNVGDDMTDLIDFKPPWIISEIWKQMLDHRDTPNWKAKSLGNKEIRSKATGGKHALGSQCWGSVVSILLFIKTGLIYFIN